MSLSKTFYCRNQHKLNFLHRPDLNRKQQVKILICKRHYVLEQDSLLSALVLVQPRKHPDIRRDVDESWW